MNIKRHKVKVEKTAHYTTYGELTKSTKFFWFALHGSHMLSEQMLYKFEGFNPKEHFVVAPEGLSRFYLKGFSGDVVATWMTKQDRLVEIADFTEYLSSLYLNYVNQLPAGCKKVILGFSQGGTSAFRWMYNVKIDVDYVLAYSTWIPEDLDLTESATTLYDKNIIYTIGEQDEYMNDDRMNVLKEIVKKNSLNVQYELYAGTHKVSKQQLKHLFNNYIS